MNFKTMVVVGLLACVGISYVYLPRLMDNIKHDPQALWYVQQPELTWNYFSQCKQHVDDAGKCYLAYSAAVTLAESSDCSGEGINVKRRFKTLTENVKPEQIDKEIVQECGRQVR